MAGADVVSHLTLADGQREAAERAFEVHADRCPVGRTIRRCVEISTELVTRSP
jgi:uncharacterized OsmC-like protein